MKPDGYSLVFSDYFTQAPPDNPNWFVGQHWGTIHPDNPHQYYSTEMVKVDKRGLVLGLEEKPVTYTIIQVGGEKLGFINNEFGSDRYVEFLGRGRIENMYDQLSKFGVGLISSTNTYKYGYFEITCKLPKSKGVWPAVWLSADDWPPEIDILEAYGKHNDTYGLWFIPGIYLKSNVFYKEQDENKALGAKTHPVWYNTTKKDIVLGCLWNEQKIEIYYNGKLVRRIEDKPIIQSSNETKGMRLILNNAVMKTKQDKVVPCEMIVKSVKIYQK